MAGEIDEVAELVAKARGQLDAVEKRDRSQIAKRVVFLYMLLTALCFVFVIVFFWFFPACRGDAGANAAACIAWKEPAEYLLKVLTTAVLPIVTLVLGYYFGTAKSAA